MATGVSVDGVNGYIVGPYDLSASMGIPGEFDHEDFLKAMAEVKTVSKKLNASGGIHIIEPDPSELRQKISEGFTFIAYSLDIRMLGAACVNGLKKSPNCGS